MKRSILIMISFLTVGSHLGQAADENANGIDDPLELQLARKFLPALQFERTESEVPGLPFPLGVKPVPVSIMTSGNLPTADKLWIRWIGDDYEFQGYAPAAHPDWDPPIASLTDVWCGSPCQTLAECNYSCLSTGVAIQYHGNVPGLGLEGDYDLHLYWDYGGDTINSPQEWYHTWQNGCSSEQCYFAVERADRVTPTVYARLFPCVQGYGDCDPNYTVGHPHAIVIQYWYFIPFNDWANNHEGDWEGVNVILTTHEIDSAQIQAVEYFFHKKWLRGAIFDFTYDIVAEVDGTHPVVFVGGYGCSNQPCPGDCGSGSHGCLPAFGQWTDTGEPLVLEEQICDAPNEYLYTHEGPYVDWRDMDVVLLPNPDLINHAEDPTWRWLAADLQWGTLEVSSPGDWTGNDVGNRAPHGPRYNSEGRWHRTGINTESTYYGVETAPFTGLDEMGWVPFALFLDNFNGDRININGNLDRWPSPLGSGTWSVMGGKLRTTAPNNGYSKRHTIVDAEPGDLDKIVVGVSFQVLNNGGVLPPGGSLGVHTGFAPYAGAIRVQLVRGSGQDYYAQIVKASESGGISFSADVPLNASVLAPGAHDLRVVALQGAHTEGEPGGIIPTIYEVFLDDQQIIEPTSLFGGDTWWHAEPRKGVIGFNRSSEFSTWV